MPIISLVTGASRGIGAAIARELASRGDTVLLHFRERTEAAEAVLADILSRGGRAELHAADVTDAAAVEALFAAVRERHGGLDVLVCNAGVTCDKPIARMSEEEFSSVIETNLTGTWRCIRHAVRLMRGRPAPSVTVIGSSGAYYGNPGQSNYAASKGGVVAMMRSLARELGPWGIRANAVVPGFTQTDMTASLPADHLAHIIEQTPLGRIAEPEDIAQAVAFFASAAAGHITGQTLVVDGGRI